MMQVHTVDISGLTIPMVVDLCLFHVVAERCGGHILPYGVRQLIKDYAWISFDNRTLREAVRLWCSDRATALQRYGDINDWDVSNVTSMVSLFKGCTRFNDPIDRHVTSMNFMYHDATAFNQPLSTWNVSKVIKMNSMFDSAASFNQPLSTWTVGQVEDMSFLFYAATSFNQPIDSWDVRHVTNM
eukprot:gene22799-biopygen8123